MTKLNMRSSQTEVFSSTTPPSKDPSMQKQKAVPKLQL